MGGGSIPFRAPGRSQEGPEAPRATDRGGSAAALEKLRTRLLDLTLSNRLLNFRQTSSRVVRVIDELPDQLFGRLRTGGELELVPVPEPPQDHPLRARMAGSEKAARSASAVAYAAE